MANKYGILFEYFRKCPYLSNLMSIASDTNRGNTVILPQGASPVVQYQEGFNVNDGYECEIVPYPSVYEDFQINCYEWYDVKDANPPKFNENVLTYEEVCGVCDWVKEQNDKNNFPEIGEKIVSIECNPFVPQIRYVDPDTNTVGYFITVRLRYVNCTQRKYVEYEI
nr:MAG TPA: Minor capsid protein from bacteriophage [Caudoviricetes sp.]